MEPTHLLTLPTSTMLKCIHVTSTHMCRHRDCLTRLVFTLSKQEQPFVNVTECRWLCATSRILATIVVFSRIYIREPSAFIQTFYTLRTRGRGRGRGSRTHGAVSQDPAKSVGQPVAQVADEVERPGDHIKNRLRSRLGDGSSQNRDNGSSSNKSSRELHWDWWTISTKKTTIYTW